MSVGSKYSAACASPVIRMASLLDDSGTCLNVIWSSFGGKGCSLWATHTTWRPGLRSASLNGPKPASWFFSQRFAQGSLEVAWRFASVESAITRQNVLSVRSRSGPGSASSMRTVCLSRTFTSSGRSIVESVL